MPILVSSLISDADTWKASSIATIGPVFGKGSRQVKYTTKAARFEP